jgi:tetratricopeptide (TPR) repeat protein
MIVPHTGDFDALKLDKIEERRHKASRYVFNGETEKAILEYNRIIFLDPSNAKFYAERGNLFIKICDLGSAIANYRKALRLNTCQEYEDTLAQLSFIKGLTLIDEGNIQDAITYVDQNLKRDENFHYIKALGFLGSGEKKLAIKELDNYIDIVPNNCVEALLLKGKILWTLGKEYEGNECFWTAFT